MPKLLSNKKMVFNRFVEGQNLTKNNYGILESDSEVYLEPIKFDVMFIPFVGVDLNGFRLGYGGGYFDRALSNIDHHKEKPLVIGLGYEYQLLDADFGEPHDLRYNKVVTENRIHIFN
jgi:5-formyltetrahydrofolate cyclo-ligase